ncbi:MAG TPA: flagellar hook-associated protein FlgK [Egicoccus sp.]|nr:flagellar hook-associated protein FlgK [Egicoccus sp.]HSK21915.1 flagellar hook-associated protein FlgK [Egicoccus sp.]
MSFVGLYTGLTAIRAAQMGIDVTGNNVANAATPGYTRQRMEVVTREPYRSGNSMVGTGVDISTIGRLRDGFLDARFRSSVADYASSTVRADLLGRLEQLTGEPDQGISSRMARLWDAAESWANNPADPATRRQVLSELASVNDTIRSTAGAWTALEADVSSRRDTQVAMVNKTLESLATLDQRIAAADPRRVGPDLLDQRDNLLDEIAELTGADVDLDSNGRALVTLPAADGTPVDLLNAGVRSQLVHDPVGGGLHVTALGATPNPATDPSVAVGGELGGLQQVLTQDLPTWRTQLNEFASTFAATINAANAAGGAEDGTGSKPGVALLDFDPADAAGTIGLVAGIGVDDLAAAEAPTDLTVPPAEHDGRNARVFADLRLTKVADDGTPDPDGASVEVRLANLVVGLAGEVRASKATADGARAVSVGADLARVSEHGVSLDEEMVGLVRYQRSLEAASRVMTTVDQALDVLVNRVGIVGR